MSVPRLDFWFEFASTYTYPAAMRVDRVAAEHGVTVQWRPFLLGPIFAEFGWRDSPFNLHPVKGAYMWRDLERVCRRDDLPFIPPDPFPQRSVLAARLALVALDHDWGRDFCRTVFHAEFGQGRQIGDRAVLTKLLHEHVPAPMVERVFTEAESATNRELLLEQTREAGSLGIFGAPSFVAPDGELFWGNDRLDDAVAWVVEKDRAAG